MSCQWVTEMGSMKLPCDTESVARVMWNIADIPRVLDVCFYHHTMLKETLDIMKVNHGEIQLKAS